MTCSIRLVGQSWLFWFKQVEPHLQSMADGSGGRFLRGDIERAILVRDYQLWPLLDDGECVAAVVTEIAGYPRLRALRLIGCAGRDRDAWLGLHRHIVRWARDQGCERMEALCRPGWARALAPLGYRTRHLLLEGPIDAPLA